MKNLKRRLKMLTRNQALRRHRKLWRWLAENPFMHKGTWPGWKRHGGLFENCRSNCFLCQYVEENDYPCLLDWSPGETCQNNPSYLLWETKNGTAEKISQAARNIAELPRRKEERGRR